MRIIIHAGLQKTGSSALQEYLASVRPKLAEAGYTYPDFGHRGHFMVTAALHPRPERYGHAARHHRNGDVESETGLVRDELIRLVGETTPGRTLILSHEDLAIGRVATPLAQMLHDAGVAKDQCAVVAYVRHPVQHYPSAVQQALKSGKMRDLLPGTWVSQHLARAQSLTTAFGERVRLRLFRPASQPTWNVVEDFAEVAEGLTGRPLPPANQPHSRNSSLSAQACAVLWQAAQAKRLPMPTEAIRRNVRTFDAGADGRPLTVSREWLNVLATTNAPGWNDLLQHVNANPQDKAAARLNAASTVTPVGAQAFSDWLLEGLDQDYLTQFARFCRGPDAKNKTAARRVADWAEALR